jgi:hypothetical protein
MRSFFTIITAIALCTASSFAQAADMPVQPVPRTVVIQTPAPTPVVHVEKNCGSRCDFFKHSPDTGRKASVPNEVCFTYVQAKPGPVEFMLYSDYNPASKTGKVSRRLKHAAAGTTGHFCVGSQYVTAAVAVEICDDINHSVRGMPSLRQGLATGAVEMCLLGKDCPRYAAQ